MIDKCPRCGSALEKGLSNKAGALSFTAADKFKSFAFVGEDLNKRSLLTKIFISPARFCPSYLCRGCKLYVVDFGTVMTREEADQYAASL